MTTDPDSMYQRAYWDVEAILDEVFGTQEENGAGEGIVADVRLALAVAERRGYQRAIDALRHPTAYMTWWHSAADAYLREVGATPPWHVLNDRERAEAARYLETNR